MSSEPNGVVECPICQTLLRNLVQHIRYSHEQSTAASRGCHVSRESDDRNCPRSTPSRDFHRAGVDPQTTERDPPIQVSSSHAREDHPPTNILIRAAISIMAQRHVCDEPTLNSYVSQYYPDIPADHRRTLIIATIAAAKYAAKTHFALDAFRRSSDPANHEIAERARELFATWNIGCSYNAPSARASTRHEATIPLSAKVADPVNVTDADQPRSNPQRSGSSHARQESSSYESRRVRVSTVESREVKQSNHRVDVNIDHR